MDQKDLTRLIHSWREAEVAAGRSRDRFLNELSESLRAQLGGVLGNAQLLRDTTLNPEQLEFLDGIQKSGTAMLGFMAHLLDQGISNPAHAQPEAQARLSASASAPAQAQAPQNTVQQVPAPSAQQASAQVQSLAATGANNPYADLAVDPSLNVRILVAEDDPTARRLAVRMLERIGYAADAVEDGVQALQAVQNVVYDAVLMDCQMPIMDGYQATQAIRQLPTAAGGLPVIALTASALQGAEMRCLVAGMDDYLAKPVDPRQLAAMLRLWVKRMPGKRTA
jgi:CheY-like chemotaxis protein